MNALDARRLVLIEAFERAPDAAWSAADAAWATAEARRIEGSTAAPEALLARRAELAAQRLVGRKPALAAWLEGRAALPGWAIAAALIVAFGFGVTLDGFGGDARIHILGVPLLALLGWNLGVYALLALHAGRALLKRGHEGAHGGLREALARLWARLGQRGAGLPQELPALSWFGLAWANAARPLHHARAAMALHALAAMAALGLVAGLYFRASFFDYRAGWESTLLGPGGMHALVAAILGPAAAVVGEPLPGSEAFAALRFPASAGESAARWIHRMAVTVMLFVVLPRLLLAARAAHEARRLARALPLDLQAPYFARLLRELGGAQLVVQVQPHGHLQAPERAAAIERRLGRALGGSVRLMLAPNAGYGDAPPAARAEPTDMPGNTPRLVLFNAAATPEAEVQGDYLRALIATGGVTAVLIDETDLHRRAHGPDAAARIEQRRRAWRAMLEAIGAVAVFVDLDDASDAPIDELAAALRHAGERAAA